jgi:glycosyltransferase involved in cell wall biosynthesis
MAGRWERVQTRWLVDDLVLVDTPAFPGGVPSDYDCSAFREPLRSAVERHRPVAVIAEYLWMAPCLDAVPAGVLRCVDTHDVMHRRLDFRDRLSNVWVTCTAEEERRLLEKADVIIAIQSRELERFRRLVPHRQIVCVPHYVLVRPSPFKGRRAVVIIVGGNSPPNVEGTTAFLKDGWPVVCRERPGTELHVYGELAGAIPSGEQVIRIGFTKSLQRAYRQATVVINPVRLGTGLKIKTVDALAHGKAVVTTSCGAEGLEHGASSAFLVADEMEAFGREVAALLVDGTARARLERAAADFARTEFTLERTLGGFLQALAATSPSNAAETLVELPGRVADDRA